MEMQLMQVFDDEHRFWRLIERDISTPWFHLTIDVRAKGRRRQKTIMPDDVSLLSNILATRNEAITVVDLQVCIPTALSKKGRWSLEPLAKLELAESSDDGIVHIYTTIEGKRYTDPYQSRSNLEQLKNRRSLYERHEIHSETA